MSIIIGNLDMPLQLDTFSTSVGTLHNFKPTFTFFSKLPIELRMRVWRYSDAVPPPMILYDQGNAAGWSHYSHPVPKILYVCKETRHEFLGCEHESDNVNKRISCKVSVPKKASHITWRLCYPLKRYPKPGGVFISMEYDQVIVQTPGVPKNRSLRNLKHLALHGKLATPRQFPKILKALLKFLPKYQSLSILTFVAMEGSYTPTMPEKEEAIDPEGLSDEGECSDRSCLAEEIVSREDFLEMVNVRFGGGWKIPEIKIRDERQLREAIGNTFGWTGRWYYECFLSTTLRSASGVSD